MRYANPILFGDYSDPDIIRAGEFYLMVSSSFTYLPGIPVLKSHDLISWETVGYAAARLPFPWYDVPRHKRGTWAPSIRFHNGLFYVYVCLPDEGLFVFTAENPEKEWQARWVKDVTGWIDPCPLFDQDGSGYLIHGFAASRAGINNVLYLHRMSGDGLQILDNGTPVFHGADTGDTTVEGPKMYRRADGYYILCPAGGVAGGYQLALRARSPFGPYERKVVLAQGESNVNGPHQGGLVHTPWGDEYFLHFQDVGPYGRVPHLQKVTWTDGWPIMGNAGAPEPYGSMPMAAAPVRRPGMTDDFRGRMSIQWQWQANPNPAWYQALPDGLRLFAAPADSLFHAGQFLSQLMQSFCSTMEVRVSPALGESDLAGIGIMGYTYCFLALGGAAVRLVRGEAREANRFAREQVRETEIASRPWDGGEIVLSMRVRDGKCAFFYAEANRSPTQIGGEFPMERGGWTGARPGLFALNTSGNWGGFADFRRFRVLGEDGTEI